MGQGDQPGEGSVGEGADGEPGGDAGQEAQLASVDIADAREVALVQEGLAEGAVRGGEEAFHGEVEVPVRSQQVRPEVADGLALLAGAQEFEDGEAVADGGVVGVGQDRADLVTGAAAPALAR